jgi:bifunctional enzyme CysN/CysC
MSEPVIRTQQLTKAYGSRVAVNKLDLVDYSQEVFDSIVADYRAFAAEIGLDDVVSIPLSALRGDNVTGPSPETPWYDGPSLIGSLEEVELDDDLQSAPFRMPVQWVNRPNLDFRGFAGLIASGSVKPGDAVRVLQREDGAAVEAQVRDLTC